MDAPRRVRADAERSTVRILEAAEVVLAEDAGASLERIADAAGLARATVHRRFVNRNALLEALAAQLNSRYERAFAEVGDLVDDPRAALESLARKVFELKVGNRFAIGLTDAPDAANLARIDTLFDRLRDAGIVTARDPAWCRRVCLVLLDEVHQLPADSAELDGTDEVEARSALYVRALLGALGGQP